MDTDDAVRSPSFNKIKPVGKLLVSYYSRRRYRAESLAGLSALDWKMQNRNTSTEIQA